MAPSSTKKRPHELEVEVLVLDSDSDNEPPSPSRSRGSRTEPEKGSAVPEDDEQSDEDIRKAIRLSLEEAAENDVKGKDRDNRASSQGTGGGLGGGGESRAELEKARLERQRQRERVGAQAGGSSGPTAAVKPAKRARVATLSDVAPGPPASPPGSSTAPAALLDTLSRLLRGPSPPASAASSGSSSDRTSLRFWDGEIRRVHNDHVPDSTSLRFLDLIGPRLTLVAAVVSAYCLDPAWVAQHFPSECPLLLIMPRSPGDTQGPLCGVSVKSNTYRVIPPDNAPGPFRGCMHTKLMIYYHTDFCRIIVPTANAVDYDWSHMDNAFYVHDFPLLPVPAADPSPLRNPTNTQFSRSFIEVLRKLGTPKSFARFASNYDFSNSAGVRLVHSLQGEPLLVNPFAHVLTVLAPSAGKYTDRDEWDKGGGLASLAEAVSSLGFSQGGHWEIEAACSSIGRYTTPWLSQMLGACSGIHPASYFSGSKGTTVPPRLPQQRSGQPVNLPIKIVYPTFDEINATYNGIGGGGTIFCPSKTWNASNFPKHLFYRGQSKRARVAAHTKLSHRRPSSTKGGSTSARTTCSSPLFCGPPAHTATDALVDGSTPSAWGRLQNGGGGPQLLINNYELGVELETKATELVTYRRPLVKVCNPFPP
ncbi:SPOSA6832_00686 [Sporobolomyces salmonicolor]|uniref:SPOSA6832_00686-mRNA-1:cds n=1 Tax=Sporidiobolus salmonicolor TaxID=5005 RepID=A0A0D6EGW6_SPOSA|nr:SPOSA6832_00686 [Sporobolomyces salmonicolor]